MKKMLKVVGLLIVMSTCFANAQTTRMGSGMFTTSVQYQTDQAIVKYNFYNALFGSINQAKRVFRNLDQISSDEIISITEGEISNQMGETFDPGHPENYRVTYELVNGDFWNNWEDSYLIDGLDKQLHWGDPRTFAINRNYPNKEYLIATITNIQTGASCKCRANCGNVLRPKGAQVQRVEYQPQPVPVARETYAVAAVSTGCAIKTFTTSPEPIGPGEAATLVWNTTCPTVHIDGLGTDYPGIGTAVVYPRHTTTYTLTCAGGTATATVNVVNLGLREPPHKSWFARNWWIVPVGAAIIGGAILLGGHHGSSPHSGGGDHTYDNGFQGGSGPSGATGGSGGQQTW